MMTPELIERDWLSLRYWLQRCVLLAAVVLIFILLVMGRISSDAKDLNHSALIVGFFTLYFVIVRAGHIVMIRSLHFEMLRKHEDLYREKLASWSDDKMSRRNIGFMLARIKREIINTTKS